MQEKCRKNANNGQGETMKLKEYDIAEHLNDENEMQMYLNDILKDEDPALVLSALDDIARARKEWTALQSDSKAFK
jgi:probable addiction module antidote protein